MATRISKHALLLPTGGDPSNQDASDTPTQEERIDDYLSRRHEFWMKDPSSRRAVENNIPIDINGNVNDVMNPLLQVSSQIEIAMALCCERTSSYLLQPLRSATTKRIALLPTSATTIHPVIDAPPSIHGATNLGILREGKEGHFLKLLSMHCPKHAVGSRALAVAILQRTVDWEKTSISPLDVVPSVELRDVMDEQHGRKSNESSLDVRRKDIIPSTRSKSFLAAGGMKLLSRWLVDSYTVVSDSSYNQKKLHVASPTGCLLLPILDLLAVIPFDKKLIVASNINKAIKRLKKALNIVAEGSDPTTLEEATHPIAGGLSVGKVIAATDAVMSSWTVASSVGSNDDTPFKFDEFDELRKKIRLRYDALVTFRQEQGILPIRSFSEYLKTVPDLTNMGSNESSHDFLCGSFPTAPLLHNVTSSCENDGSSMELQSNLEPKKCEDQSITRKRKERSEASKDDLPLLGGLESQEFSTAQIKQEQDSF